MSVFTTPLKDALTLSGGSYDIVNGRTFITGAEHIGLAHYPIFDENYRDTLNGLIFDRYMNREIGMESISMFSQAMRRRLNEIMPVYNKMYKAMQIEYDPLSTVNLKTLSVGTGETDSSTEGETSNTAESTSGTRAINSDFPQHMLAGDKDYATSGADSNATTTSNGGGSERAESKVSDKRKSESETIGYQGVAADLIANYVDKLISVDLRVLDSLSDLFMLVYDVPNTYTNEATYGYYSSGS